LRMVSWPSEITPVIGTGRAPADLGDQPRQVLDGRRQEALGQEDLAGEAVAQHPENLMADVGLEAVDGQDDAALGPQQWSQPLGIGGGQGPQLIVAVQEVGDGALGEDDPPAGEFVVDLGDTAVLGIAELADQGHDVESELVMRQGEVRFGLGAIGQQEPRAIEVGAAADREGQSNDAVEGGDGAEIVVVGIGPALAFGAVEGDGREAQVAVGFRSRSFHWTESPLRCSYVHYRRRGTL